MRWKVALWGLGFNELLCRNRSSHFAPERGWSSFDQPQHVEKSGIFRSVRALRLVFDTAALPKMSMAGEETNSTGLAKLASR